MTYWIKYITKHIDMSAGYQTVIQLFISGKLMNISKELVDKDIKDLIGYVEKSSLTEV